MSEAAAVSTEEDRRDAYQALRKRIQTLQAERRGLQRKMEGVERDLMAAIDAMDAFHLERTHTFKAGALVRVLNTPAQDQEALITGTKEGTEHLGEDQVWHIKFTRSKVKTRRKQRFLRVLPTVEEAIPPTTSS